MDKPNGLDRNCLQTQLANYKLIAEVNTELLEENLFTEKEFLGKLELAQRYLNESHRWEELGDRMKSNETLNNANMIIVKVGTVIKRLLYQDSFLDDSNLQQYQISAGCWTFS
jgi:hypothetical protein